MTGIVLLVLGSGYDRAGGSGAVRVLQRRLADLGAAPGAIDGRYGPRTENAVERFQAAHGLVVDGICGPKTLAALAVPVAVLFPGAGEQQPGGSPSVRALQRDLAAAGDAPGPIDGRYGPLTAQAVERFQGKHRLGVDGIVGSYTWRALVVARRAAARRSPRELAVPRSRPARRVPGRRAVVREPPRAPGLPVGLVLLGLAALGLLTASYSYARASARVRRARANPRQERGEHGHGPARAAWQGNGVLVAGEKEGER